MHKHLSLALTALLSMASVAMMNPASGGVQLAQAAAGDRTSVAQSLSLFDGAWSGRGTSRTSLDSDPQAAACGLQARYRPDEVALDTSGECATTSGQERVPLDGRMVVQADGTIDGGFFSGFPTAVLLGSSTQVTNTSFEIAATYEVELDGELRRIETVASVGFPVDDRFRLTLRIRNPDTGALVDFTQMDFAKIGGG